MWGDVKGRGTAKRVQELGEGSVYLDGDRDVMKDTGQIRCMAEWQDLGVGGGDDRKGRSG